MPFPSIMNSHSKVRATRKNRRVSPVFIRKLSSWLVLSTSLTLAASYAANVYQWDPDENAANNNFATQTGLGGAGTWDTSSDQWWDGSSANTSWNNSSFDIARFGGLSGGAVTLGEPIVAGGLIFNVGGYSIAANGSNTLTLQGDIGNIPPKLVAYADATIGTADEAGILGSNGLIKSGGGTLVIRGDNTGFSGDVTVQAGTLALAGTTSRLTSVGDGTTIRLNSGTLDLRNDQNVSLDPSNIAEMDNPYVGYDIVMQGNATIRVANNGGSSSNGVIELRNLTVGSNTLTVTNGSGYGVRFMGSTALNSAISTINSLINPPSAFFNADGAITLGGQVAGAGALNKIGAGTLFIYNADGHAANTYSGGTNIFVGTLALGDSGSTLGSGRVTVAAGAILRLEGNANLNGQATTGIYLSSTSNSLGVLALDANFSPSGTALDKMTVSPYGAALQINSISAFTGLINLSVIGSNLPGNGPIFLGAIGGAAGAGSSLTGFNAIVPAADGVYRLGANNAADRVLTVGAADKLIGASNSLVIGSPIQNVQTVANGSGTVTITRSQSYGGLTTVNKVSTLNIGGTGTFSNPFGTGSRIDIHGTVNLGGGAIAVPSQTTFNVFQGGALNLSVTDSDVGGPAAGSKTLAGSANARLNAASTINLNSGTFSFAGFNGPYLNSQTVSAINFAGGNTIIINPQTVVAGATSRVTATTLTRVSGGTILFATPIVLPVSGTAPLSQFGSANTQFFASNLSAPAAGVPIISPAFLEVDPVLIGGALPGFRFVTYGSNGITPVAFTSTNINTATAADVVEVATSASLSVNPSVYALRINNVALTANGSNTTVTIGANAPATDGAGLILANTGAQTHSVNFVFGSGGNQEAIIYNTTSGQTATLSGTISATGLTKSGLGNLALTGVNTGLNGPITLNQGTLSAQNVSLNFRPITLNAGVLDIGTTRNGIYLNNISVNGDATITAQDVDQARIGSLLFNARSGGSTDPIVFTTAQGLSVAGSTTLNTNVIFNSGRGDRSSDVRARVLLSGPVTGVGSLTKWNTGGGNTGVVSLLSGNNSYSGGTIINGGALESLTGSGTPFGSGSITVNPSGILRIVRASNISTNSAVTVNSDLSGLGVISLAYNGNVGTNGNLRGDIAYNNGNLGAPFSAVLGIDAVGYSGAINFNTLGSGTAFLGTTIGGTFTGALTASTVGNLIPSLLGGVPTVFSGGVYRLGGGGSGFLNLAGAANQLTGSTVVQVGAISNVTSGASVQLINGGSSNNGTNQGAVQILNANNYSGFTILNGAVSVGNITTSAGILSVGNNNALGTSKIIFNGGGIAADANTGLPFNNSIRTISNSIGFTGDAIFNGSTDLELTSSFGLADNQVGVTRTLTVNNTTGLTILSGVISDGAGTASLGSISKAGAGALVLSGLDTYTGFTNINAGALVVSDDSSISTSSQITFGGGTGGAIGGVLAAWNNSFTTNRDYVIQTGFAAGFDVGAGKVLNQSILSNISGTASDTGLFKTGLGTLTLGGVNSFGATGSWAVRILNGVLQVGADVNLGDPTLLKGIVIQGGTIRATDSFTTGRQIIHGAATGGIDIASGKTLTLTGVINSNGTNLTTKTGAGTLLTNAANGNLVAFTLQDGTFSSSSFAPLAPQSSPLVANTATNNILSGFAPGVINSLYVGLLVTGPGIPANTRILAIDYVANTATLSTNTTATATAAALSIGGSALAINGGTFLVEGTPVTSIQGTSTSVAGNSLVTVADTGGLRVGQTVTGANIAAGTTILAIRDATTFLLSATPLAENLSPTTFTLSAVGQSVSVQSLTFGGGGNLKIQSLPGISSQFATPGISRSGNGTLVLDPGTSTLGGVGNTNAVRVLPANINGAAPGNVNGILGASIITQTNGVGNFATYINAAQGIGTYSGATVSNLTGQQAGAIGNIITAQNLTGTNSIYALRTIANITGGTLRVGSVNLTNNQGGILINGNVAIDSNLIFDPSATSGGALTSGQGLIYVAPDAAGQVTGQLLATSLVKFGDGSLTLNSAGQSILGALTVQDGTLTLGADSDFDQLQTDLVLNNQGVFDLAGRSKTFASLGNTAGVAGGGIAGGLIGNSGSAASTFTIMGGGTLTTIFGGNIVNGIGSGTGTVALVKSGTNTVTLAPFSVNNPEASVNTFTGGTTLNQGTLIVQDPRGLGTGAVTLAGGVLNLQSNGGGINGTIILGDQTGTGSTVNVIGNATINVDRVSANTGNSWQIGDLNMNESVLTVIGGNSYHLRVNGTTSLLGRYASMNTGSTATNGTVELVGQVVGSGTLNRPTGLDVSRTLIINNSGNTYSGGTSIQSGRVIVNTTTGTPLGTGEINVFSGGMLSLIGVGNWAPGKIGSASVRVNGAFNTVSFIGLDEDNFDPTAWLSAPGVLNNTYGTAGIAITRPFYTRVLDQSAIGDGRTLLTGGQFGEFAYIAPTLAPGLGNGTFDRTYRLAGGPTTSNFALSGADNVLSDYGGATNLYIGLPVNIVNGSAISGTGSSVVFRNSNNFTGGTTIWKGSGVILETGASPDGATNNPLGTGAVDVWGTLQVSGLTGSFVDATTGLNSNLINLRPGGTIVINDFAGSPNGGQGRWSDSTGIDLNGGQFQLNGAANIMSIETMGVVNASKQSRLFINRSVNGTSGSSGIAQLNIAGLTRTLANGTAQTGADVGAGALFISSSVNGSLGIPASTTITDPAALAYDRLVITGTAPTLGGATAIGSGVKTEIGTAGMVAPWVVYLTGEGGRPTFLTYSPTTAGGNSGFQGLTTASGTNISGPGTASGALAANGTYTPGANQVGYSRVYGTSTAALTIAVGALTDGTHTVDFNGATGTLTLADAATSVYALRTNQSINPLAGATPSLTIVSGGLIQDVNNVVINSNGVPAANTARQNMSVFFGNGGNSEALIFTATQDRILTINAQIFATALTKQGTFGGNGNLTLTGVNMLTGPVTVNQGILFAQNTLNGYGTIGTGVFNNQDVFLGGAANPDAVRLILDGSVGDAVSSLQVSSVRTTTRIGGTVFVGGDSRIDTNNVNTAQRITNLTFADLGANKPVNLSIGSPIFVQGTTTLGAYDNYINAVFQQSPLVTLGGLVQGGTLYKFGNATLVMAGSANTYAGTVINQAALNTSTSIVASSTRTGRPFGAGPITVNPGAQLRVMNASNITNNAVTLISDFQGLAGLGIGTSISAADLAALVGSVNWVANGELGGVVSLDAGSWNTAVNIAALEAAAGTGKPLFLGSSINPGQTYINGGFVNYNAATLGVGMGNTYRIGGGGSQGSIALGAGQYENVLSGNATLQLGAMTTDTHTTGPHLVNGNFGQLLLNTRNDAFTGAVFVNAGSVLTFGNGTALQNASAINVNGGQINLNNSQTLLNNISVLGDSFTIDGGNGNYAGTINIAPSGVGGTRSFFSGNSTLVFSGVIEDAGTGRMASNVIRTGNNNNNSGSVIFRGMNTYHGTTTVNAGFLFVGTDVLVNEAGALGISDTPVIFGNVGGTASAGAFGIVGQFVVDRDLIFTGTVGTGLQANAVVRGQTLYESRITGGIAINSGTLIADNRSVSDQVGGVLDLQGPITGTGILQVGSTTDTAVQADGTRGTVRLSGDVNGFSASTFSGGTVFRMGRMQIAADTYYTGAPNAATVISGPLGTGALSFGASGFGNTGTIEAYGADRTIVNAMNAINWNGDSVLSFGGHYSLTFTRDLNINSEGSLRSRSFNVLATQGVVTFSGNLTSSGTANGRLVKSGPGTLVLSGTNTYTSSGTNPTPTSVTGGVLRVTRDANLGAVSGTASRIDVGGGSRLELAGANTIVWDASSNRVLNLTGGGQGIVVSDSAGVFTINTAVLGANGFSKEGPGRLNLNNTANAMTSTTIGGFSTGGGTAATTALSGTPFGPSVAINGGVLSLVGPTSGTTAQSLTLTTALTYGAGSYISLDPGAVSTTLTVNNGFGRVGQGTLTILATNLANLGTGAGTGSQRLIVNPAPGVANGMLITPSVYVRLAGVGQDANFATYGANGFQVTTAAPTANTNGGTTSFADIAAGGTSFQASALGANNSLALRTSRNIINNAGGASNLIIANGGLILNRNTAASNAGVTIGTTNLTFGAVGAPVEALVYVADGASSTATISSSFTATNFTKSGPGDLLLSGTNNVMVNTAAAYRTLTVNEGTLSFSANSSLPNGGAIVLAAQDNGRIDLNGLTAPTIGGLSGTGNIVNSGAATTLNVATQNSSTSFTGVLNLGAGGLTKSGNGTLTLGAPSYGGTTVATTPNVYSGGTTVNAGLITSGSGIFTTTGTLLVTGVNSLGSGPVTLAGGILAFQNALPASEVIGTFTTMQQGPGSGYNLTIAATNNYGSTNTSSVLQTGSAAASLPSGVYTSFNNLTVNAPVLTVQQGQNAANITNGFLIGGTTTFAGNTTLNVVNNGNTLANFVLAGAVAAPTFTLTKIGSGNITLIGDGNGVIGDAANNVGAWKLLAGTVEGRMVDGGANPFGTNDITMNGGTLAIRHDGDNLSTAQTISTFSGMNLTLGSTALMSSANYTSSLTSLLNVGTLQSGSNKTLEFNQLRFGGPLGTAFFNSQLLTAAYSLEFLNGVTMLKDAYIGTQNQVTLSGGISGNGTLFKTSNNGAGGELLINTAATNTGGTVSNSGIISFGAFRENTRYLSNTAKLGAGNITINPSALIRFNSVGNLNGDQLVDLRSNVLNYAVIGIGDNSTVEAYHLRVPQASGLRNTNLLTALNAGGGVLALNSVYSQALDLNRLGDGTFFLGSTNNGAGVDAATSVNGTYIANTLGAGRATYNFGSGNANNAAPVYRLGAGGGILSIGIVGGTNHNVLTNNPLNGNGVGATVATSLVVGGALINNSNNTGGSVTGNLTGTVFLNTNQNYTGATLVNRGSTLEIRGTMETGSYETFGTLAVSGSGGTFVGEPAPLARPGSTIRLDNTLDLLPVASTEGRWGDTTAVVLDGSTFQVVGNASMDLIEKVGQVTVNGNSIFTPRGGIIAQRIMEIQVAGFTRGTGGQLSIEPTTGGFLGVTDRVTVSGETFAAQLLGIPGGVSETAGMVAPWMYNGRDNQFLTYGEYGFVNAGFNVNWGNAGARNSIGTLTDRTLVNGGTLTVNAGQTLSTYALRMDSSIARGDAASQTIIASGGLIFAVTSSLQTQAIFGSSTTPMEAIIYTASGQTGTIGDFANPTSSGQITAAGLSKGGDGALQLDSEQGASFTGNIALNRGSLTLRVANAGTTAFTTTVGGNNALAGSNGTIFFNGAATTLNLRSDVANNTTFSNDLVIRAGNPLAAISVDRVNTGAGTGRVLSVRNLTFGGSPGDQGQTLAVSGGNSFSFQVNGTTDLGQGGNAIFNLNNGNNTSVTLAGPLTGTATLVREGASSGNLFLGISGVAPTVGSTASGGVIMLGNIQANATAPAGGLDGNIALNMLPSGTLNLLGGTLSLRVDGESGGTARFYTYNQNTLQVNGNVTINADKLTAASTSTNKYLVFNTLAIGGQSLTLTSANSYRFGFNNVALTGFANITVGSGADSYFTNVSDSGAGLGIIKNGGGWLFFNGTNNNFSGGVYANQGAAIRFGTPAVGSATATAGTGTIQINPGGQIYLQAAANVNTAAGQMIDVRGIANGLGMVRLETVFDPTALIRSTSSNGLLVLPNTFNMGLNLAAIGDGTFQLAMGADNTYTATTLGAGRDNVYRIGGNSQNFRITAANANVFTDVTAATAGVTTQGAARVQVGSLGSAGGVVVFNSTNNYTGGTTIVRGTQADFNTGGIGSSATPFGSGQIDVFGSLRNNGGGGFQNSANTANNNALVLHPGSSLILDSTPNGAVDRFHNNAAISLNGSNFTFQSGTGFASQETVGAISFAKGSRLTIINPGAPTSAHVLTAASLTRVGSNATLVFVPGDAFGTNVANSDNFVVTGGLPATTNGMLPAYFVNGFVNALGNSFVTATDAGGGAGRVINATYTAGALNLPAGLTAGTAIADVTANTTLTDSSNIYAMRLGAFTISNAAGQINTITLNGSAAGGGLLVTGNAAINPHLNFNNAEAIVYTASGATLTTNGDLIGIGSAGVTKFGAGTWAIGKDQSDGARGPSSGYSNGWAVNEGQLNPLAFGALGNAVATNVVNLNGSTAGGANGVLAGAATLRLQLNQGHTGTAYYSMGALNVLDRGSISYDPQADDRTQALGAEGNLSAVNIMSTGGSLLDAQFYFNTNRNRSMVLVGNLSVIGDNAGAQIFVDTSNQTSNLTTGTSSGISVASLMGGADDRITKWGNGMLYVRGASTFSGAVNIEQGGLQVNNLTSLGDNSATNVVTVKRFGTLDLNVTGFNRTNVNFQAGSILRLTADNAIGIAALNLGAGTLQVANDQTATTTTITLNGGAIEGFIRTDDLLNNGTTTGSRAVYRTLGAGIGFNLAGDSFVGQSITEGANGLDNGVQGSVFNPFTNAANGVILEVQGNISGVGGLTKQGYDTVTLSGNNTYAGLTNIRNGMLRLGSATALPTAGTVNTTGGGVLDLNGNNASVARLTSNSTGASAATTNLDGSGYVTNSATSISTLKMSGAANAIYGGVIQYNVAVTKEGANVQTLSNNNTYVGATTINQGALEVSGSLSGTTSVDINSGGTLTGAASSLTTGLAAGPISLNSGGVFSPGTAGANAAAAGVNSVGTFNAAGGLLATGGGTLKIDLQTATTAGTPGGLNDQINVTGGISLAGTSTIQLTLTNGYVAGVNDLFFIALNDGEDAISGSTLNLFATSNDQNVWQVSTTANAALGTFSGGNDIAVMVAAVPEPTSMGLLAASLGLSLGLQRFRRRRSPAAI